VDRRDPDLREVLLRDDASELPEVGTEELDDTELTWAASPQTVQYPSSTVPPQLTQVLIIVLLFASR
jgi:hypothetical protein